MTLFIISFIAGVLTVLAPCILPLLPVVLGGSVSETQNRRRPLVIVGALALSVFLFTFLIKASTVLIGVPESFWRWFSAIIIGIFGLTLLFPSTWARITNRIPGMRTSNTLFARGYQSKGALWGDAAIGIALGPIFASCSPTYFIILATVLPQSFAQGVVYMAAYVLGLSLILLAIAVAGQKLVAKLNWAANPSGWFKKVLGIIFLLVAVFVGSGADKKVQTAILDAGFLDVTKIEQNITEILEGSNQGGSLDEGSKREGSDQGLTFPDQGQTLTLSPETIPTQTMTKKYPQYIEIVNPSGFVNSEPFKLADLIGKKVILLDFMTYSCINCQRTFPHMNEWYEKYKDDGLEIVGIHTPEFAFEKNIDNVRKAAGEFGITFPLVLDNDYATWQAYQNRYWPHKFLINLNGNIVYDHVGEGAYEETERRIVEVLNTEMEGIAPPESAGPGYPRSPEIYFGSLRNAAYKDMVELKGSWAIEEEYAQNDGEAEILFVTQGKDMHMVAEGDAEINVHIDGTFIKTLHVSDSKLYTIYQNPSPGTHTIRLVITKGAIRVYTFTFG